MTAIETAPAKLNLFLHITGRRADGYHEIESIFAFTQTGDQVRATPSDQLTFSVSGEFADTLKQDDPGGGDNLVLRAARALRTACGIRAGAELHLTKSLPVAAGIGGGSSDAAATLRALNRLWALDLAADELARIGASLGADVPACIYGKPAWVSGIGEHVTPLTAGRRAPVLLVNPGHAVSTPQIFRAYKEAGTDFDHPLGSFGALAMPWVETTQNSLTAAAISAVSQIKDLLADMATQVGAGIARMSGSGATCFALFVTEADCSAAASALLLRYPGAWIYQDQLAVPSGW